ncbi:Pre-mRNA-splicing factor [Wickerhamomyces ciferrii]|uniref:Pre-mRNA-splicing factor 38 n=1 Tax=Wickerhamomyces ciferrii (strain ATCC 14091 / BCRC 22168 / CBS 111 / JCM 3599 / NBRC 0793 / NRRL Y-1031 F-60-10) TaxID=1206466 RepID=K0KUA6_WICCF|nr:Pre-mRNA-splicing factor [Wickerhamomyces ciferrii]CCH45014.1 Pre-mRNA-splicing factor [Wickerhamomyces ciferrii]
MVGKGIIVDRELSKSTHKGQNSILLIEKIIRERIFDSLYWKQYCFNVNAALILDRCVEIRCVGGLETSGKPMGFICLLVKLIQLMPQREIIEFYLNQGKFKYLKVLAMVFIRLVYRDGGLLKKQLNDYRKVRLYEHGEYKLSYVDEIADKLLNDEMFIGLNLPYMKTNGDDESDDESDGSDEDDSDSD